jgi:large subunit ribosomal protein L10
MVAHVSEAKKKVVETLVKLFKEYPIIGAIDLEGMPTAQLQKMREKLRNNNTVLLVTKRRVMKIAIEKAKDHKKGIEQLEANLKGMPALIFSKISPFKLYKQLKESKSEAHAKPGQIAPKNIEIKAGATNFLPGPIIGELAAVGIKSGVDAGKVAIKQDAVVCKEG